MVKVGGACKRTDCHSVPTLDDCLARMFTTLSVRAGERDFWNDGRMGESVGKKDLRQPPSFHQLDLSSQEVQRVDSTHGCRSRSWTWTIDDETYSLAGASAAWWAKRHSLPEVLCDVSS